MAPTFGYVKGDWYGLDFSESGNNASYTGNFRWITFWANQYKIVVHHFNPFIGKAFGNKFFFSDLVVNEYHISVPSTANI